MNKRFIKILVTCFLLITFLLQTGCGFLTFEDLNPEIDIFEGESTNTESELFAKEGTVSYEKDETCYSRNNLLNNKEQIIYDVIYAGMLDNKTTIKLDSVGGNFESQSHMKETMKNAIYSVLRDHPQFFMYDGAYTYEFNQQLLASSVSIQFETVMSVEEADKKQKELDKVVDKLIAAIKDMDEYNKSKYIYTYLAQNTIYKESENAHNMYGCLVEGVSVCEGYAKAYSYIMQKCGMQVAYISGKGKDELHAWNLINIDDNWYHVDCTWGDPVTEIEDAEEKRLYVDYSYLHLTTESILINHTLDDFYKNIPDCMSVAANYHAVEGEYLLNYSDNELSNIIKYKVLQTNNFTKEIRISIRYAVPSDVRKANKWIEDGYIKDAVSDINYSSFSYSWSYTDVGTIDIKLSFKF